MASKNKKPTLDAHGTPINLGDLISIEDHNNGYVRTIVPVVSLTAKTVYYNYYYSNSSNKCTRRAKCITTSSHSRKVVNLVKTPYTERKQ